MATNSFPGEFRIYEKETEAIFQPESVAVNGDGDVFDFGSKDDLNCGEIHSVYWKTDEDEIEISWFTGWTDRNNTKVFEGDILKRVRHLAAEHEREWIEENEDSPDVDDIESFVDDYSGALGVVRWGEGGFYIEHIEGHKWAFHGPESDLPAVRWDKEVEVVGNIWENPDLL